MADDGYEIRKWKNPEDVPPELHFRALSFENWEELEEKQMERIRTILGAAMNNIHNSLSEFRLTNTLGGYFFPDDPGDGIVSTYFMGIPLYLFENGIYFTDALNKKMVNIEDLFNSALAVQEIIDVRGDPVEADKRPMRIKITFTREQ